MLDVIMAIAVSALYFLIGYKLSQVITINGESHNTVLITLWPVVFVLFGLTVIASAIINVVKKKEKE